MACHPRPWIPSEQPSSDHGLTCEQIWTEHAINHVKEALEGSGLEQRVPMPPAICFVALTGFTRLTEEQGDEVAVRVAGRLASLVNNIRCSIT
jgi:class 3 adenylate cyclase